MERKMNRIIKASLVLLLSALGFSACSKPEEGPGKKDKDLPDYPYLVYYGVVPTSFQEIDNTEDIVSDATGTMDTPSLL